MTPFGRRILKIKHENLVSSRSLSGYSLSVPPDRESIAVPSLNSGLGVATRNEPLKYTGDKIIGIVTIQVQYGIHLF